MKCGHISLYYSSDHRSIGQFIPPVKPHPNHTIHHKRMLQSQERVACHVAQSTGKTETRDRTVRALPAHSTYVARASEISGNGAYEPFLVGYSFVPNCLDLPRHGGSLFFSNKHNKKKKRKKIKLGVSGSGTLQRRHSCPIRGQ